MQRIAVSELKQKISQGERLQLIDVRSSGEFSAGHIPQAVNMPMEQVEARLDDLQKAAPVVLICQSGNRASMTCEFLLPYRDDVMVLEGGTSAWIEEGLPVIGSTASRWSLERQVRLVAGALVLTGAILSLTVNQAWVYLSLCVGAGLVFAGLTNICGMAAVFALMPWNKPKKSSIKASTEKQTAQN